MFDPSVLEQIHWHIKHNPDRVAVHAPAGCTRYGELGRLSDRIVNGLDRGRRIDQRPLAVLSSRPEVLAAALAACLRVGAVYAPVDPEQPRERIRQIVTALDAAALVTDSSRGEVEQSVTGPGRPVVVADLPAAALSGSARRAPPTAGRLLWIMHTSGSTGRPKGVMQTRANVSRFVGQVTNAMKVSERDKLAVAASLNTHAGAVMCLAALCNAATFFPLDLRNVPLRGVIDILAKHGITLLFTVPAVLKTLRELDAMRGRDFSALRMVRLSGQTVTREDIVGCWSMFPDLASISVGYGTTETGGISQHFYDRRCLPPDGIAPVGTSVPGVEVRILDDAGEPVGPGETGEIAAASRFFSPGYWNDPAATRAAFTRLEDGFVLYKTGDVGQLRPDGVLVHCGRRDLQFSRAGNRIEPREIELALAAIPAIEEAVVRPWSTPDGMSIVAYLVARRGHAVDRDEVRQHLRARLPWYMLPNRLVQLESIPRTRLGKVAYEELLPPSPAPRTAD